MTNIIENIIHENKYSEQDAYAIAWDNTTVNEAIEYNENNDPMEISGDHMIAAVAWMKELTKKA